MKTYKIVAQDTKRYPLIIGGLFLAGLLAAGVAGATDITTTPDARSTIRDTTGYPADNSAKNMRDRDGNTLTPEDQSGTKDDRLITKNIRETLVKDDYFSLNAKNIKVITINGVVTLRGPVSSIDEKSNIVTRVSHMPKVSQVNDLLEVQNDNQ